MYDISACICIALASICIQCYVHICRWLSRRTCRWPTSTALLQCLWTFSMKLPFQGFLHFFVVKKNFVLF